MKKIILSLLVVGVLAGGIVKATEEPDNEPTGGADAGAGVVGGKKFTKDLFAAVLDGSLDNVKKALDAGANPNAKNEYGATPLHWAASRIYHKEIDFSALNIARAAILKLLLDAGADPALGDKDYNTALHLVAKSGTVDDVKALLAARSNIITALNCNRETPLQVAVKSGNLAVVKYLVNLPGINVNQEYAHDKLTLAHWAAMLGNVAILEVLREHGCNFNQTDKFGNTTMHWAARSGFLAVVEYLLTVPEVDLNLQNNMRETAYDCAMLADAQKAGLRAAGRPGAFESRDDVSCAHLIKNKMDSLTVPSTAVSAPVKDTTPIFFGVLKHQPGATGGGGTAGAGDATA